jgi:hypothetical protein
MLPVSCQCWPKFLLAAWKMLLAIFDSGWKQNEAVLVNCAFPLLFDFFLELVFSGRNS